MHSFKTTQRNYTIFVGSQYTHELEVVERQPMIHWDGDERELEAEKCNTYNNAVFNKYMYIHGYIIYIYIILYT